MADNKIAHMSPGAFSSLVSLKEIMFMGNQLNTLNQDVFDPVMYLEGCSCHSEVGQGWGAQPYAGLSLLKV